MSCPACFSGTIHDGTPAGTETVLHGLPTYIASPAPSEGMEVKAAVVIVSDALGWKFTNTRCLADAMAAEGGGGGGGGGGWRVYVPDFMDGNAAPPTLLSLFDALLYPSPSWISTLLKPFHLLRVLATILPFQIRNRFSVTYPRVERFVRAVREEEASGVGVGLGVAGYCWGGKHATVLASLLRDVDGEGEEGEREKRTLVDAAFTAHPGGLSLPADIANLRAPWSMAIGDDDFVMPVGEVEKAKEALKKSEGPEAMEARSEVVVYPGAKHGFAVRGNPGDENDRRRGVEAREQCLSWLKRWFAKGRWVEGYQ